MCCRFEEMYQLAPQASMLALTAFPCPDIGAEDAVSACLRPRDLQFAEERDGRDVEETYSR